MSGEGGLIRVVRFQNVGMRYGLGPEILHDVSFELDPGSFHFLTGPSGAGKSSLLKLIYLASRPSHGLITLFDRDIALAERDELPALRRRIGVVFQEFRLLDHLSVMDNVALPLRVAGAKESDIRDNVAELLDWVGLADHKSKRSIALTLASIPMPPAGSLFAASGVEASRWRCLDIVKRRIRPPLAAKRRSYGSPYYESKYELLAASGWKRG